MKTFSSYDLFGNIAVVKFSKNAKLAVKKRIAKKIMKEHSPIKTVLEKSGKFSGRLRKMKTKFVLGEKTKEALYKENGCSFRLNIDTTYFSPRLSNERKEIASLIKENDEVLVMFAGVAPFSIVIAKNSKARVVYSNEINREANKYGELNIGLNKLKERVFLASGDVKRIAKKLASENKKFDVIVMPRPQLKDSFLQSAFLLSKKGTRIYYYDFCKIEDKEKIVEKVKLEAERSGNKIKILNVKHAGDIAPYKIRLRVDFEVV